MAEQTPHVQAGDARADINLVGPSPRSGRRRARPSRYFLIVAKPLAGTESCRRAPPIANVVVLAAVPALYMTATMLPSGFLKASASTPLP